MRIRGVFGTGLLQSLNKVNQKMRLWRSDQRTGVFLMVGFKEHVGSQTRESYNLGQRRTLSSTPGACAVSLLRKDVGAW